jgi:hypothetical protein
VNAFDTSLYYTLSTIAQTLAGALGLLAAFMVIRLTAPNQLLRDHARQLYEAGADNLVRSYYARGDHAALFAWYRARFEEVRAKGGTGNPPRQFLNPGQETVLTEAEQILATKSALVAQTRHALFASAAVILGCFFSLATVHWLKTTPVMAAGIMILILGGATYCLWCYLRLLKKALREA